MALSSDELQAAIEFGAEARNLVDLARQKRKDGQITKEEFREILKASRPLVLLGLALIAEALD